MRKILHVTISDQGRDLGKTFVLTEMPASRGEKWGTKALIALTKAGIEVPDELMGSGMAGIALYGINTLASASITFEDVEPLLDEMMECVQIAPDPRHLEVVRPLVEDDIEEIATRIKLRAEVFKMHVNFSGTGSGSTSISTNAPDIASSSNGPTFQGPLRRSSPRNKPRSQNSTPSTP